MHDQISEPKMVSSNKRRRLAHPTLSGLGAVKVSIPPKGVTETKQVLPNFLHNALFAEPIEVVDNEACPFKWYINLGGFAWERENESIFLIERPCYEELIKFLDKRFESFELGTGQRSAITWQGS